MMVMVVAVDVGDVSRMIARNGTVLKYDQHCVELCQMVSLPKPTAVASTGVLGRPTKAKLETDMI